MKESIWKKDLEFSQNTSKMVDKILLSKQSDIKEIKRLKGTNGQVHMLDQYFAIDGLIVKNSGIQYTFQEKIRRKQFLKYDDLTLEYFSNTKKQTNGDFFHFSSDFYFHGYTNLKEDQIIKFRIISVVELKKYIDNNFDKIYNSYLKQNSKHSNASFFAIPFFELEKEKNIVVAKFEKILLENIFSPQKSYSPTL